MIGYYLVAEHIHSRFAPVALFVSGIPQRRHCLMKFSKLTLDRTVKLQIMKKYQFFLLVFVLAPFGSRSQSYNQGLHFIYITTDSMEVYYKKNDHIVKQKSYKINNTTTSSKLSYSNDNFASNIVISEFVNDTSISIYKWAIADKIEQKADSIKNIISNSTAAKYSELLDSMTYYISDNVSGDTVKAELMQVLFYKLNF